MQSAQLQRDPPGKTNEASVSTFYRMIPKVIIDTDAGIDDAMAIFMALKAHKRKEIEVIGITAVNGNTSLTNVCRNVMRILETVNLENEIPVYLGASKSLVQGIDHSKHLYHGHDGFGDAEHISQPNISLIKEEIASIYLYKTAEKFKGQVYLAALGPLTNLALSVHLDSNFFTNLAGLFIMGGNYKGEGNTSMCAEFNFYCDPEAAKVVLENVKSPINVVPWETCLHNVVISYDQRREIGNKKNPVAELINKIEERGLRNPSFPTWISCDQLCVAWLLDHLKCSGAPKDCKLIKSSAMCYATVECAGQHTRGLMVMETRGKKENNILFMKSVDIELYLNYLHSAFSP